MKAALYARVSTKDKDQDPEVQLIKLRDFAAGHGWEVHGEYTDFATGRDGNRPGLKKLLHDARAGKFETVIIVRIDRIMRSLSNLYSVFQDLEAWGVSLVATDQDLYTSTTAGRLMFGLLGLLAQWEVEQTSDRVRDGLKKARKAGKRIGRPQVRWTSKGPRSYSQRAFQRPGSPRCSASPDPLSTATWRSASPR